MNTYNYPDPVARLLTLGETRIREDRDYLKFGLTAEHVPDLIRLVKDEDLRSMLWDDDDHVPPQVYAQVHAWRALTQLKAEEAIPAFIDILYLIDDDNDDFVQEEIPLMLAEFGEAAVEPCWNYLLDPGHGLFARVAAAHALAEVGTKHPKTRGMCISALASVLENYFANDETLNGFIISYLVDLKAVDHLAVIERAFGANAVDLMIMGDLEDVKAELGVD